MKINKLLALFAAVMLFMAPSCSNDDDPLKPLPETTATATGATYNSLSFSWDKVASATQYGYEIYNQDGELVLRSVTDKTEVTVSDLAPATEYTFKVWAFAAIGSGQTSSEPTSTAASTDPLKQLEAPTVECDLVGSRYILSWSYVEYADSYSYTLVNSDGETVKTAETTSRTVLFSSLAKGEYTFSVKAITSEPGYETEGTLATYTFTVL